MTAVCLRHRWMPEVIGTVPTGNEVCIRIGCEAIKDKARSRRGRNNDLRGKSLQRWAAEVLGWRNIVGNGPEDLASPCGHLVGQAKSGGWFSDRDDRELTKLDRELAGEVDRIPSLIVIETPGPGRRRRAHITFRLTDGARILRFCPVCGIQLVKETAA